MGSTADNRVVEGHNNSFALIFNDEVFELCEEIFTGFDITVFINARMVIPVGNDPFCIDRDQFDVLGNIYIINGAAIFGQESFFIIKIFFDHSFLGIEPFQSAVPIVISRNH